MHNAAARRRAGVNVLSPLYDIGTAPVKELSDKSTYCTAGRSPTQDGSGPVKALDPTTMDLINQRSRVGNTTRHTHKSCVFQCR